MMEFGPPRCWCGAALGEAIGGHYRLCPACGTAVVAVMPAPEHFTVAATDRDFYGHRYWPDFQRERGLPDMVARAHADLPARCLHWLRGLLKLVTPPGRVLEIGCGHGGFVRLLNEAGFDATGTELSSWVVDFARATFGVRIELGSLETLDVEPGLLAVCAFDVLEHASDPGGLARRSAELLRPDGVLFVQTPCYRGEGPEWEIFQKREHIFLFSEKAIRWLLEDAGFRDVAVAPGLFPYDVWVTAARDTLPRRRPELPSSPALPAWTRVLFTLGNDLSRTQASLSEAAADLAVRLGQIETLEARLAETEADQAARLDLMETLSVRLAEAEAPRSERIEMLGARLAEAEADRAARLEQIETLGARLAEAEADRGARLGQIETLTGWLREAGAAAAALRARLDTIERSWVVRTYRFLGAREKGSGA
jgi:2-polyprenyl-3-methyl-5-hydroxy-6-metoxy-1,4-benzoquinol methylase